MSGAQAAAKPSLLPSIPGVPVMTGTHFHALDEKGRVIIPAKLRPAFSEQFWLMLDENDNIGIYNYQTGLDVLQHCEQMIAASPEDEDLAAAVEHITGSAELMTVESGWRVPIPEIQRFYAQLDKEVVTVGVINHAVLWSREKWEAAQARRSKSGDVRRAQAGLMRAAASKQKSRGVEIGDDETSTIETEIVEAGSGFARVADGGNASGGNRRAAAASAGNGRRSARVLTLSRLGR